MDKKVVRYVVKFFLVVWLLFMALSLLWNHDLSRHHLLSAAIFSTVNAAFISLIWYFASGPR